MSFVTVTDMDTGEILSTSSAESSYRKKKGGNPVSRWWNGLGPDRQTDIVKTGLAATVLAGLPIVAAAGATIYSDVKNWLNKRKERANKRKGGASKTTKPVNQTYQGRTSVNYTTGGGSDATVPYNNYGDYGNYGDFGSGGEHEYADPIIL